MMIAEIFNHDCTLYELLFIEKLQKTIPHIVFYSMRHLLKKKSTWQLYCRSRKLSSKKIKFKSTTFDYIYKKYLC